MLLALHPRHQKQDSVSNEEVLKRASIPSTGVFWARTHPMVFQVQLRWDDHTTRMKDVGISKVVFFRERQEGKRDRGSPTKSCKDQLKRQLVQAGSESTISHGSRRPQTETVGAKTATKASYKEELTIKFAKIRICEESAIISLVYCFNNLKVAPIMLFIRRGLLNRKLSLKIQKKKGETKRHPCGCADMYVIIFSTRTVAENGKTGVFQPVIRRMPK